MGRVIAILSGLEHAGRTATAVNLSVLLARSESRVLLVDFGAEKQAARRLGMSDDDLSRGQRRHGPYESKLGVAVLPWNVSPESAGLAAGCEEWRMRWDWIVFDLGDTSPHADLPDCKMDFGVIVASGSPNVGSQVAEVVKAIDRYKGGHPEFQVLGVLLTMTGRSHPRRVARLVRSFPVEVFPFTIPWEDSAGNGRGLAEGDLSGASLGRSARGYVELTMEVLSHG